MTNIIDDQLRDKWLQERDGEYTPYTKIPIHIRMTASEARRLLKEEEEKDDKELDEILDKMHKAIVERKHNHIYVTSIKHYTKKKLEDLGYTVGEPQDNSDGYCPQTIIKISF